MTLQSCLDIFPEKVQRNGKSYTFHVFKRKEGYMIDYHSDGMACFFACGSDLYKTADHMLQILKYHNIIS